MGEDGRKLIGVIGGSRCSPEEERLAEEVGREVARRGAVLVCGGLGGVMEAACRGARQAGGLTIGILPGNRAEEANPWVEVPIVTGLGEARNVLVVKSCRAVIAIGGEFGTLSEIALALRDGVPVVGLKTWQLSKEDYRADPIVRVQSPAEAVEKALALAEGGRR
ncbi:MAG: TIGR00725 family protein [Chloroflexi bacterium]|nr:MAG: TIGR00725 family protein [Chloroflexota bacterium]